MQSLSLQEQFTTFLSLVHSQNVLSCSSFISSKSLPLPYNRQQTNVWRAAVTVIKYKRIPMPSLIRLDVFFKTAISQACFIMNWTPTPIELSLSPYHLIYSFRYTFLLFYWMDCHVFASHMALYRAWFYFPNNTVSCPWFILCAAIAATITCHQRLLPIYNPSSCHCEYDGPTLLLLLPHAKTNISAAARWVGLPNSGSGFLAPRDVPSRALASPQTSCHHVTPWSLAASSRHTWALY